MAEQQAEGSREIGVNILTAIALFLYVLALWVVVSFDRWFYYWTTP